MKIKKRLIIAVLSIAIFGCKQESPNTANTNANPNLAAGGTENNKNGAANAVVNINTSVNKKPSADNSPKRIAFSKGANWGAVNTTLAAGAAQRFVVSAKKGQTMDVEVSSKETSVNLIRGKAQTTEDFGFLTAELESNGDYVFEVRNSTKKEIKTSVKVTVEGNKNDFSEIDESDATVKDDDDVLPPPSNREEN